MKKKKILVCDDDEGIAEVVKIVLTEKGYEVEVLYECKEINKQVKKIKPDLIILDLWIPEIGGEQATKILKADQATKGIPIIILSAHRDTEKIARRAGADDFLNKPFDIDMLEKIVDKYLI
jgi:two-component system, OmpR family, alkaline phosphatase synthesis response regulator PhoP